MLVRAFLPSSYGVSRFYGVFDLAAWNELNEQNETLLKTSHVTVDSGEDAKLMFHTPLDRSYLCADLGHIVSRFPSLILMSA